MADTCTNGSRDLRRRQDKNILSFGERSNLLEACSGEYIGCANSELRNCFRSLDVRDGLLSLTR